MEERWIILDGPSGPEFGEALLSGERVSFEVLRQGSLNPGAPRGSVTVQINSIRVRDENDRKILDFRGNIKSKREPGSFAEIPVNIECGGTYNISTHGGEITMEITMGGKKQLS